MNQYKVKIAALGTIVSLIGIAVKQLVDGDPVTNPDWNTLVPSLILSVGVLFSRQNDVSSEQAGIK